MIVYKFGGASVASAEKIANVANIIAQEAKKPIAVVVSAMGKTTNTLESLLNLSRSNGDYTAALNSLKVNHEHILSDLFGAGNKKDLLDQMFKDLETKLVALIDRPYDFAYDQIVSFGELISTIIVTEYLKTNEVQALWIDAREVICTDNTYREAIVDWAITQEKVNVVFDASSSTQVFITQGFIGGDGQGNTTTLGREGSDFTAAILSFCLDAEFMSIWKDVPGILTADPRLFENVAKIDRLSYKEAIEMTYYGAKVIHPKTIKPLQNKNIPLWVKSFIEPAGMGTLISGEIELTYPPMIVIEPGQALIHISTRDFSFVGEDHLSKLFDIFNKHRVRVNMMRNTAISFSVCTNDYEDRIHSLAADLEQDFKMVVDKDLELITIRHYTHDLVKKLKKGKIILFEERLQQTIQIVVKEVPNMVRK